MKGKRAATLAAALVIATASAAGARAAVPASDETAAYDQMVHLQDQMDGLDVTVRETTIVPGVKNSSLETINIKASGLQDLQRLKAAITVTTEDDGEKSEYYSDGYFYTDQSGKKVKYAMQPEEMLEIMNYYIYLELDTTRLSMLMQDEENSYTFNATSATLGDYSDKVLEGAQEEHQIQLVALQGTVKGDGTNITQRNIQTVYTMKSGDEPQTCTVNSRETFHNPGQPVTVELPDLGAYAEASENKAVNITLLDQTVYATADVNVRAQNNITTAIVGGAALGMELQETGYTSDGWTQILYNGAVGYVFSEYVSTTRPIVTKDMSGTMYAAAKVNVRQKAGTDSTILGVLQGGDAVTVTGYTNNGWIRVSYNGRTAYINEDYLTWDQPVTAMGGTMYVSGAQANVRAYYSTDSAILGTLSKGDAVEVTGYTPNNWIEIAYSGGSGYIYADLLTWTQPSQPAIYYITGIVDDATMNAASINGDDGRYYTIRTVNVYISGGLSVGDYVGVYYVEEDGALWATQLDVLAAIDSYIDDDTDEEGSVSGVVVACGMSAVTIACDDGETRTFDKSGATIECPGGLYSGLYVSGWYYYDSQRGYVLDYLS